MGVNTQKVVATFGITVELAAGVLDVLPDIRELIEKYSINDYQLEVVLNGIGEDNAVVCVSADMSTLTELNLEFTKAGVPANMVQAGPFSSVFNTDTDMIILAPSGQYDRINEIIDRYIDLEQEREAAYFSEDEEDDTYAEEPEQEEKAEEEIPDDDTDDLSGFDTDDHGPKNRGSDKAKHRYTAGVTAAAVATARTSTQRAKANDEYVPIGSAVGLDDVYDERRREEYVSDKEYAQYLERKREDLSSRDERRTEESSPGTPVTDHRSTSYEREQESNGTAARETASNKERSTDGSTAQTVQVSEKRAEYEEKKRHLEENARSNEQKSAESGKTGRRSAPAATTTERITEGNIGKKRIIGDYERYSVSEGNIQNGQSNIDAAVHGSYSGGTERTRDIKGERDRNIYDKPADQKSVNVSVLAAEHSGSGKRSEYMVEMPYKSEKKYVPLGAVVASPHFDKAMMSAKALAGEVIAPRDSEGGRGMQNVLNVARPMSSYIYAKFMRNGVTAINQNIAFNEDIYASALYSLKGITRTDEQRIDGSGMPEYTLAAAKKEVSSLAEGFAESKEGLSGNMAQLNDALLRGNMQSFSRLISSLSKEQLLAFAKSSGLSAEMTKVLMDTPGKYLGNFKMIQELGKNAQSIEDKSFVAMLKGSVLNDKFGKSPLSFAVKSLSRRLVYSGMGSGEGVSGLRITTSIYKVTKNAVKMGLKGTAKVAKKLGASEKTIKAIEYARAPIRHTFGIAKEKWLLKAKTSTIKSGKLASKVAKLQERIASKIAARMGVNAGVNAAAGAGTGAAAAGTAASASGAAGTGAAAGAAGGGGAAAGGAAAGGGIAVAGIVLLIILAIIIIMIAIGMVSDNAETQRKINTSYTFVENTEIVDELVAEFDAMNTQFNVLINDAKNHRGDFASSVSYEGGETALTYESYKVIFRDAYGNELDPKTVDLNNTKAIIAMASQYFPYPFSNHSASTTESGMSSAQRKRYEEAKQLFKDYCYMLWASTHRITIEEYYPGDSRYEDYDDSEIATYLGKCDRNGETIWLPEDLEPKMIRNNETGDQLVCDECHGYLATGYGNSSKALCAHPFETYESTDGWKKTGKTQVHILCPGHRVTDYGTDENGKKIVDGYHYEYCGIDRTPIPQHQHTCFEWQYVCGGHMSAVVYVTIGDVSRIPSMGVAGDVDYGAVASYKDTGSGSSEGTGDGEKDDTGADTERKTYSLSKSQKMAIAAGLSALGTSEASIYKNASILANTADRTGISPYTLIKDKNYYSDKVIAVAKLGEKVEPGTVITYHKSNITVSQEAYDAVEDVMENAYRTSIEYKEGK